MTAPIEFGYDLKEKTIFYNKTMYFMKGSFENGCILAFYSHSPCGCVHDQEVGWGIFDLERQRLVAECETRCVCQPAGEDWKEWMEMAKEEHGKLSYFKNEDGTHVWKLKEC
jgi:hypothetical protein